MANQKQPNPPKNQQGQQVQQENPRGGNQNRPQQGGQGQKKQDPQRGQQDRHKQRE